MLVGEGERSDAPAAVAAALTVSGSSTEQQRPPGGATMTAVRPLSADPKYIRRVLDWGPGGQ
jgi:hypothetical protein